MKHQYDVRLAGLWHALLLFACLLPNVALATNAPADAPVQVEYHLPTDVFNILDNLPDWLPGYTASSYGEYWETQFGLDAADKAALAAYADFRQRTAPAARSITVTADAAPDLFAPSLTLDVDSLAQAFLQASDVQAGMAAALAAQTPSDRAMLIDYYARFGPRAVQLAATHSHFDAQSAVLASTLALPGVPVLAQQVRLFYGVDAVPPFMVRFLWWPGTEHTQAKVRGRTILLQGPADNAAAGTPMDWAPIVLHEYTHYVSASQPLAQKQQLSAAFLRGCPAAAALPNPLNAIEEPLAIYWGQYRFEHDLRGRMLPADEAWYFKPLPDQVAKAIALVFPATAPAPSRDDRRLMRVATRACRQAL